MRPSLGDRGPIVGSQGCRSRETGSYVQEQRPPSVAVRHPRPSRPRGEEILRQILRRLHRSHKHSTASMHTAQSRFDPWSRVPRERQFRRFDISAGEPGRGQ